MRIISSPNRRATARTFTAAGDTHMVPGRSRASHRETDHEFFDIGLATVELQLTPRSPLAPDRAPEAASASSNKAAAHVVGRCTVLLYIGLIGAAMCAAGGLQLLDAQLRGAAALALLIGGGALAIACWRQARTVLDETELPSIPLRDGS